MSKPLSNPGLNKQDTVGHLVARVLKRHGITQFFGQSLPSMFVLAAEELGLRQIAYRTENAGGYMADAHARMRSEEHTSELQSQSNLVCRLLLEKKKSRRTPHLRPGEPAEPERP